MWKSIGLLLLAITLAVRAQVVVPGYIQPSAPGFDTYGTHDSIWGIGGFMTGLTNISQLTNTSGAGIPMERRKVGMVAVVNGVRYRLGSDTNTWTQGELVVNGGTGATNFSVGDLLIGSGTNAISSVSSGTNGQVLTAVSPGNAPLYKNPIWLSMTNGIGEAFTMSGTNTFNGKVLINPEAGTFPSTSLLIGNDSTLDDSEALRAFRNVTLDRDLLNQWTSAYIAWHLNLNGFNSKAEIFPLYAAYQMEGSGGAWYVDAAKFVTTMKYDSSAIITNMHGVAVTLNNNSTNGGTAQNARGLYVISNGLGTNGNIVGIELSNFTSPVTGKRTALKINQTADTNNFALYISGGASNYITGGTLFTDTIYSQSYISANNGTAALPSIYFSTDNTSGIYRPSGNAVGFSTTGVGRWRVNAFGHWLTEADNSYDIGQSTTNRPRFIYAGSDIVSGADVYLGPTGQLRSTRGRFYPSADGDWTLINAGSTASGMLRAANPMFIKGADYSITAIEARSLFLNSGATNVTFTLPVGYAGGHYQFKVDATAGMTIKGNGAQRIYYNGSLTTATTGSLSSVALGSTIQLIWDGTYWTALYPSGAWQVDATYTPDLVTSLVASGSAVSLTTATAANVTSLALSNGAWDVGGTVNFSGAGATTTALSAGISSTSATIPSDGSEVYSGLQPVVTSYTDSITLPPKRIVVTTGSVSVYLVGRSTFSAGTTAAFGQITARRVK